MNDSLEIGERLLVSIKRPSGRTNTSLIGWPSGKENVMPLITWTEISLEFGVKKTWQFGFRRVLLWRWISEKKQDLRCM